MSTLEVITNNHWRQFVYRKDVPNKILEDQFAHLDEENYSDNFFQYQNFWYHLSEFMRLQDSSTSELKGWDGASPNGYFSGVLIKVSNDCETFKVGTFLQKG